MFHTTKKQIIVSSIQCVYNIQEIYTTHCTKYYLNLSGKPHPGKTITVVQLNTTTVIVLKPLEVIQPFKQMANSLAHSIFTYDWVRYEDIIKSAQVAAKLSLEYITR